MTFSAALLAVTNSGDIIQEPSSSDAQSAASLHVLGFSSKGHLLLNESQGRFDFETWETVRQRAESICRKIPVVASIDGDVAMCEGTDEAYVDGFIRETVEDRLYNDYVWKTESI